MWPLILALPVAVCTISPLHAWAQEPPETNSPVVGKQADAQITQLLDKVEALVRKGQITSPAGDNAAEFFAQVLTLLSAASPAGLQRVEGFSLVLKQRSLAEQAAGNKEISLWFSVFSEVAAVDPAAFPHVPPRSGTVPTDISVPVEPRSGGKAAADLEAAFLSHTHSAAEEHPRRRSDEPTTAPGSSAPTTVATISPPGGELPNEAILSGASLHPVPPRDPDADHGMGQGNPEAHEPAEVRTTAAPMIDALLRRGAEVLADGDISAARLLFTRAAESGSGKAALALGDTYNQKFLAEHGVQGLLADPESAKRWYRKAVAFGEPQAKQRLLELDTDRPAEAMGLARSR